MLIAIAVWLFLPSNFYLRQALINMHPKIDRYTVFDNRKVVAASPQAWTLADDYNRTSIPDKYLPQFEEYGTVAYVIIHDRELFFERYWDDYSSASRSNSFSMAKSVVSLAVGCAIDDGFIRSIDQPVADFFPQFVGYNGKTLTLRHLLTMSAGMDFQEAYSSLFSPTTRLYYGNALAKQTLAMCENNEPGKRFVYQSAVTQLLAFIVAKATGENISSYVSRRIWTPIHAEADALWSLDTKNGMEKAFCCFNTNARDFARLGQLVLDGGAWEGQQIVSADYIRQATTADTTLISEDTGVRNNHYGFQFWVLEKRGCTIPYFRGLLGQYIFVIPNRNAVVVRLGQRRADARNDAWNYPADVDVWLDAALDMLEIKAALRDSH
jgi:CubicO group peptidase (beta-lactamase class C family)